MAAKIQTLTFLMLRNSGKILTRIFSMLKYPKFKAKHLNISINNKKKTYIRISYPKDVSLLIYSKLSYISIKPNSD